MDAFALRDRLIEEDRQYRSGFITIKEPRARRFVDGRFAERHLWLEPPVQLRAA